MRSGRPIGSAKLHLTAEVSQEIARRVRLRIAAELHSTKAIATDYGVTEAAMVGAIRRLRERGLL